MLRLVFGNFRSSISFKLPSMLAASFSSSNSSSTTDLPASLFAAFRSHSCTNLNRDLVGKEVKVAGWLQGTRIFGDLVFGVLRDHSATLQLVGSNATEEAKSAMETMKGISAESVVSVSGIVLARPENQVNANSVTGGIELQVNRIEVLNKAEQLAITVLDQPSEDVRMRYRYIDLRRPQMQLNLKTRSKALSVVRRALEAEDFTEIETPTLFRSTPEGAREFLVPTRTKGKFFALVQSPQQYKQMLMASGVYRYFQVARCYRDESGRADRQPEFTQIDLELSFAKQGDVQTVIEKMITSVIKETRNIDIPRPFPRMTFDSAMKLYGSDKPDTRIPFNIKNFEKSLFSSSVVSGHPDFGCDDFVVSAFCISGVAHLSRKDQQSVASAAHVEKSDRTLFLTWGNAENSKFTKQELDIL